jgi:FixJ family two-component response regulator
MPTELPVTPDTVIVIDDDAGVRQALASLLRSVGLAAIVHGSVDDFMKAARPDGACCLVLDVRLPGKSGLEFQHELASNGVELPLIFITGHGDIPMSVQAMKGGAVEFLTKPFRDQDLLDAIAKALDQSRSSRQQRSELMALRARFETLTAREREVMKLVASGKANKNIATELGSSEVTVKVHRSHVMQKMQADSVADLVRIAVKLNIDTLV